MFRAGITAALVSALLAGAVVADEAAVADEADQITALDDEQIAAVSGDIRITVEGEANGVIVIDLFEDIAPLHAERITALAAEGAYDGVVFHRVIEGFMAQTGDVAYGKIGMDMRRAGTGGSEMDNIVLEATNERSFLRGKVGMARSQNPNSANSQFFIMFDDGPFLDGQYTIVGEVVEGMDVVDQIKRGSGQSGAVSGAPDVMTEVTVITQP